MGQGKDLSRRQRLNPSPPEHRAGAPSTELRELTESKGHLTEFTRDKYVISILLITIIVIAQIMAERKQSITFDLHINCFINMITDPLTEAS